MKVALYARVSKADDTQTTINQLLRLRDYVKRMSLEVFKEYEDFASGADPNRPALAQMMRDARGHRFGTILVVRLDRIARSNTHLYNMITEFNEIKVGFQCIDQPEISTTSPMGKALLAVIGAMAELERDLNRERTNAGLDRARAQGKILGRPKKAIDAGVIGKYISSGMPLDKIAENLGISRSTLKRRLKNEGVKVTLKKPDNQRGSETDDSDPTYDEIIKMNEGEGEEP